MNWVLKVYELKVKHTFSLSEGIWLEAGLKDIL